MRSNCNVMLTDGKVHLCPAGTESVPFAGRQSCALFSGMARATRTEAVGCRRLFLWNSFQPSPFVGCLGTSAGAPPPGSSRSDVPGPRRPEEEHNRWRFSVWIYSETLLHGRIDGTKDIPADVKTPMLTIIHCSFISNTGKGAIRVTGVIATSSFLALHNTIYIRLT